MDLLGAYVLDALLPDEKAAVEAYLPTSPACQDELRLLRRGVNAYALVAEERDPGPELRNRLWAAIQEDGSRGSGGNGVPDPGVPPVVPFTSRSIVSAAGTPPTLISRANRLIPIWGQLAAAVVLLLVGALAARSIGIGVDDSSTEKPVLLGRFMLTGTGDAAFASGGKVEYLQSENIMRIEMYDLPDLAEGEVYQLWVIDDGVVTPSVVFTRNPEGSTAIAMVANPVGLEAVAVTREPGPIGSITASSAPFILAPIDTSGISAG